jgi:hypothetical protein
MPQIGVWYWIIFCAAAVLMFYGGSKFRRD